MRTLTTARLSLEPWRDSFERDLVRMSSDPRVMRYIGEGVTWDPERAAQRHQAHLAHWRDQGFGWRGIIGGDGDFLGVAALNRLGDLVPGIEASAFEIGWWIEPFAWGRGVATEAATAIRDEAFSRLGAERLVGRYQPDNEASGRVMVKLGMSPYGETAGRDGQTVRVYTLVRRAWGNLPDRTSV